MRKRSTPRTQLRTIRKSLGTKLRRLDQNLINKDYILATGHFNTDLFEDACRPIIHEVIGHLPQTPGNETLPSVCLRMCIDIAKKRKRYLDFSGAKVSPAPPKKKRRQLATKVSPAPKTKKRRKFYADIDDDVEKLFGSDDADADTEVEEDVVRLDQEAQQSREEMKEF
jgi:hypothetical protein